MNIAREGFGVCAFAGQIYVIGGLGDDFHSLSSVEKYSLSSDSWSAVAPLPESRSRCAAVSVGSAIYVLGGGMVENQNITAIVLKFNGVHNVWSEAAPMPEAMAYFAACTLGTDIYVFGGLRAGEEQPSVFKYNTEANAWSVLAPMPVAIYDHCVSVLNGLMYIVGLDENGRVLLRFSPVSGEWATLTSPLTGCDCGASFVLGDYLYAAGGLSSQSTVERYDAVTDTWTAVARMLKVRNSFGAVTIGPTENTEEEGLFDSLIAKAIRERH
jgi:N-acetylneuraminic acid mutarotase